MHKGQPYNRPKEDCCSNLAKVHALDAFTSQSRADRRGRRCLAGADYEFHNHIRDGFPTSHWSRCNAESVAVVWSMSVERRQVLLRGNVVVVKLGPIIWALDLHATLCMQFHKMFRNGD